VQSSGKSTRSGQTIASPEWDGQNRRDADRRDTPTRPWTDWLTPRRRERGRRDSDRSGYVDRYTKRDVALLLSVFLLNVGDAFFTMLWLERGGKEANPIMEFFLDIGPGAFLVQKCLVVGFWLLLLVVHKNFRFARSGLYATLVVYGILMLVHFSIILFDIEPPSEEVAEAERVLEHVMIEYSVEASDQGNPRSRLPAQIPLDPERIVSRRVVRSTLE
jgi:hypothetical protein